MAPATRVVLLEVGAKAEAPKPAGAKEPNTIIYIHGIGNKPAASILKCQWDTALFSARLGDRSRMAYWVNRDYYPRPLNETCATGDFVKIDDDEASTRAIMAVTAGQRGDEELVLSNEIKALTANPNRQRWLAQIGDKMIGSGVAPDIKARLTAQGVQAKVLPLPEFLRRLIARNLTRAFLRDVNDFVFVKERRDAMEQSLIDRISAGGGPFALDPVALDKDISDDFEGRIENVIEFNPDSPQHPHSGTGYLKTNSVQAAVRRVLGATFSQSIAPFAIAKDLVTDLEDGFSGKRHATLIQLSQNKPGDPASPKCLNEIAASVETKISEILAATNQKPEDANLERLRHYVAADLTRLEVETLRSMFNDLKIDGIWRNASKRALVFDSTHTVQARPANIGYGADGSKICWAVLDTGICAGHPHFLTHKNVLAQWDCTQRGKPPLSLGLKTAEFSKLDRNGHGTHVAGIIAGEHEVANDGGIVKFAGMAPRCTLYGFKVLDDNGNGSDSSIIKALDLISYTNETAGQLIIHGVNLSLGGNFDPSIYGTGIPPFAKSSVDFGVREWWSVLRQVMRATRYLWGQKAEDLYRLISTSRSATPQT